MPPFLFPLQGEAMIPKIEDVGGMYCVDCTGLVDPADEWAYRYFGRCATCVAKATMEDLQDMSHFLEREEVHNHDPR